MPPEHAESSAASDQDGKDKGPPSRGKIGWALCVLAILLLTIVTTAWFQSRSQDDRLTKGFYVVVAAVWSAVVLPSYLWITRKKT